MSSAEQTKPDDTETASDDTEAAPTKPAKQSILRHPRFRRVVLALVALLGVGFAVWWFRYRPYVSTDDARVAAPVIAVAPKGAGGQVQRVLVREGQTVKPGQKVVELDASAEKAKVERAQALVSLADARVGAAQAQLKLERRLVKASKERAQANVSSAQAAHRRVIHGARREEIARARAEVAESKTRAAQARRNLARAEDLSKRHAVTEVQLEAARTAEASARAELQARKATLHLLQHGSRPEDVSISRGGVARARAGLLEADAGVDRVALRAQQLAAARAQAARARAELAMAKVALDRMTLRSTIGGKVIRVTVDPGDFLAPGQGAVTVVDMSHAWIAANIEETSAGLLRPGQAVRISIDEGGELSGHVEVVTQTVASQFALIPAENAAGNFTKVVQRVPIRIAIDPSPRIESLRIGESVEVRIRVR